MHEQDSLTGMEEQDARRPQGERMYLEDRFIYLPRGVGVRSTF